MESGPPPPPPPPQSCPGVHPGVPPPPPPPPVLTGGEFTCLDCSLPLMVTVAVAALPPPLATGEAPAVLSPGSSTLASLPRASLQARRGLPASSVPMVQLSE